MHSKLIVSALVIAPLLGAPVIALAQNEPAQPAPSAEGTRTKAPVAHHKMTSSHRHYRTGTTTGMSSYGAGKARPGGKSVAPKPPAS
jgi:hypothetical protein